MFDLEIRLSHTTVSAAAMSTTFANNITSAQTLVLGAVIALSGSHGSNPNPFDIVIDVEDLFAFNGADNLLLEITLFSRTGTSSQFDSVRFDPGADQIQRVWGLVGDATGTVAFKGGLVTQFVFTDGTAVPEPASVALLGLGLAGLGLMRRRRRAA